MIPMKDGEFVACTHVVVNGKDLWVPHDLKPWQAHADAEASGRLIAASHSFAQFSGHPLKQADSFPVMAAPPENNRHRQCDDSMRRFIRGW